MRNADSLSAYPSMPGWLTRASVYAAYGVPTEFEREPNTSAWKRFTADMMRVLPIDSQL